MLSPTGWAISTPPELGPYGWTTTDLWVAPLASAIFATLTHAQPFWADLHRALIDLINQQKNSIPSFLMAFAAKDGELLKPVDAYTARSICALFLAGIFASRAVKNFWGPALENANNETKNVVKRRGKNLFFFFFPLSGFFFLITLLFYPKTVAPPRVLKEYY